MSWSEIGIKREQDIVMRSRRSAALQGKALQTGPSLHGPWERWERELYTAAFVMNRPMPMKAALPKGDE